MIDNVYELIFCNDGILRTKLKNNVYYPLIDIQNYKQEKDIILNSLEINAKIEEGSTLSSVIKSLKPWSDVLSKILDIDINAYVEACLKPCLVKQNKFQTLIIEKIFSIYKNDDSFETENINSCSLFCKNDDIKYSLFLPFNEIRNLPILLNSHSKTSLFNCNINIKNKNNNKVRYGFFEKKENINKDVVVIISNAEYTLKDILYGIFSSLFNYLPLSKDEYDNEMQRIEDSLKNINVQKLASIDDLIIENEELHEEILINIEDECYDMINSLKNSNLKIGKINFAITD